MQKDIRFKYFYQTNSGPSAARNFGLTQAQGDYIQFLDADDIILPKRLHVLIEQYVNTEENVILYSDLLLGNNINIFETSPVSRPASIGKDVTFNDMYAKFLLDFIFIPSCLLLPKKVLLNVNWSENLSYSEDWDYYLSILKNNYRLRYFSEPLVIYRNTPNSLSKNIDKTIKANYFILGKWINNRNLFVFSKRCALLYKRSIFLYLLKKSKAIIRPSFDKKNFTPKLYLFIILIYPLTMIFLLQDIMKILYKRIKKNLKNEI